MTDRFTWSAGQFRITRPRGEKFVWAASDFKVVAVPGQKYSPDQPRDDHGRFGEGSTFYHGSPTAGLTAVAARIDARQFDNATSQLGAFVTDDPKYAEHYAGKTGTVYEAAVVLQNPYHMSYSEFNYFQSPDKDADGKSLPGEQWEARAAVLKDEAIALRTRLESEGHDGIVVKGSGMRPTEVASFTDIPLAQKKAARRPGQKGEGTGHGFRGNRWTGGIDGEGRRTGPPKLVSPKVKPTGLTHEKLTPEQLGDVQHVATHLYRATQHGWSGRALMTDRNGNARAVPLYPIEHASTLAAIGRLQAAGMSHEEMVRSLGLVATGRASVSEYNLSTYSRELLMMDAIKTNPTGYETNRDMYGTGVERQRLEDIASAINVQREAERIAEGVRLSQGAHMIEGKFPEFARPELEAVRVLIQRDGSLFPEKLPHLGPDGKVDPTAYEDGQRVWREHLDAITAVGRAIEEEKVARQGPALAMAQATREVREELMVRQRMAWDKVQVIPYRAVDTFLKPDHPRYAEEHQKYLDYTAARGEYDSLKEQANIARIAAESADSNYSRVRFDVLSEIRSLATRDDLLIGKSTNAKATEAFKLAANYFPADWMQRAMGRTKLDVGVANGRAFCDGHLAKTGSYLNEDNKSTAVHEMSHFMENYGGRSIEASEYAFYMSRTNDGLDPTRKLRDVQPGYRYKASEITRTDTFAEAYMGKDYGGTPKSNYELLSMGMEHLRASGTKYTGTDTPYRHWLLGTLATV